MFLKRVKSACFWTGPNDLDKESERANRRWREEISLNTNEMAWDGQDKDSSKEEEEEEEEEAGSLLLANSFVSTKINLMKCIFDWIPQRICAC